jgi:hypothetical protein
MTHPKFLLYGDESCSNSAVVYALVGIRPSERKQTEDMLAVIKREFGAPPEARLHCRELFAGDARRKSSWAHLSLDRVFELYESLAQHLSALPVARVIGFADRRHLPTSLPGEDWVPRLVFAPKEVAAWCATAALVPFHRHVGLAKVKLWVDPDRTKIDWMGRGQQFINAISGWVSHDPNPPERITPEPISGAPPQLIELADFIAYFAARVLSPEARRDKSRFGAIYSVVEPMRVDFKFSHEKGGLGMNVPNVHQAIQPLLG